MSSFYDTEPQPTASVVFHTTGGEIAVELFAKQTPLTSRNFLQHCLDGYYEGTIFHRLVPGFILQGGDPTGTGNGGESIYDNGALSGDLDPWPMDERKGQNAGSNGIGFKDEFHSRLKFNRRGLLAMANEGKHDTNGSQFFFTLDKTEELNGKNTLFGRVAGPTIYNLAKMGEAEVQEGSERPTYPTQIKSIEIVTNPFTDMRKTERATRRAEPQATTSTSQPDKKKKRKKGVNKTLLSFGDDIEDDEEGGGPDVDVPRTKHKKAKVDKERRPEKEDKGDTKEGTPLHSTLPSRGASEKSVPQKKPSPPPLPKQKAYASDDSMSDSEPEPPKRQTALEKTNAEIAALKASMRRTVHEKAAAEKESKEDKRSELEKLVPKNTTRGKRLGRGPTASSQDPRTLKFLGAFQSKLAVEVESKGRSPTPTSKEESNGKGKDAEAEAGEVEEPTPATEEEGDGEVCDLHFIANCQSCRPWDKKAHASNGDAKNGDAEHADGSGDDDDDDGDWMAHTLNCAADKLGKDLSYRKKAEDELLVIDPREKARKLQEEMRSGRGGRPSDKGGRDRDRGGGSGSGGGGGGSSGRSWDQRRNDQARAAKMAQASALSGRGAR